MARIVVGRTGGTTYLEPPNVKNRYHIDLYTGRQCIHWLAKNFDDVRFVGSLYGDSPIPVIPLPKGDDQVTRGEALAAEIGEADIWIDLCAGASALSIEENPFGGRPMRSHINIGVTLIAMSRLKTRRISISSDPRTAPRNSEMFWLDECLNPEVILGQESLVAPVRIAKQRCEITTTYGALETWHAQGLRPSPCKREWAEKLPGFLILSHAHLKDGRWNDYRDWTWCRVIDWMRFTGMPFKIVGDEWDLLSQEVPECVGPAHPKEAWSMYDEFRYSVIIAPTEGYTSPKPYHCLHNNVVPLLWNEGPLRYPDTAHFPADSEFRVGSDTKGFYLPRYQELNLSPNYSHLAEAIDGKYRGNHAVVRAAE